MSNKIQPFLLVLLGGSLALAFFIFKPFLAPLALAAVFAVILQPLYKRTLRHMKGSPGLAALLTVIIAVVVILLPLSLVATLIGVEAQTLYQSIVAGGANPLGSVAQALESLERFFPGIGAYADTFSADLSVYVKQGLEWLINNLGKTFSSIAGVFLSFFIFFIAIYYLLRDGTRLRRAVIALSPLSDAYDETVFERLELAVNSVIKGNLTIALIQGVLTAVGFTIFGIPNGVLWGTVAAVAALIPGIGTALVFLPAVIFLFLSGSTGAAIGLLVWGVVAVGLIDNLLGPRLVGNRMQLHPLLVLLSVLGGLAFFGPIGIFLGPLSLSLLFALLSIYSDVSHKRLEPLA